jgi:ankyrin repeat protein
MGDGSSVLHILAKSGGATILAQVLDAGVNLVNFVGETPLHVAARFGNVAAVRVLLESGADPKAQDLRNRTPINVAMKILRGAVQDRVVALLEAAHGTRGLGELPPEGGLGLKIRRRFAPGRAQNGPGPESYAVKPVERVKTVGITIGLK